MFLGMAHGPENRVETPENKPRSPKPLCKRWEFRTAIILDAGGGDREGSKTGK
jgi:hypothetical protein